MPAHDVAGARQVRNQLIATRTCQAFGFWVTIAGWWLTELSHQPEPDTNAKVDWLHGQPDAHTRWLSILTARRG